MIQFMQKTKKSLATLSLALLISAPCTTLVRANEIPLPVEMTISTTRDAVSKTLLALLFLSAYDFATRKATNDAPEYNFQELLNGKNIFKNLKALWRDGIMGHPSRSRSVLLNEDGSVSVTEKISPKGIVGNLMHNSKGIMEAITFTCLVKVAIETLQENGTKDFSAALYNKLEKQYKILGLVALPWILSVLNGNGTQSIEMKSK